MIKVDNLHKAFGKVQALNGASFSAADGQIVGLLGPNGAGKTTALRVLFGLLARDTGTVSIDGIDPASDPIAARKKLGILTDQVGLYERLTTREHLRYFGELHGMSRSDIESGTTDVVELLGMADIIDRRAAGFSQGQRLKVALARALLHRPRNLLLDEPTRGLDVMSTRALRRALQSLRERGCCIIMATHVMQEVTHLCDDVIVIAQGKVVAQGAPQALCEQTGISNLEDAFVSLIGTEEGIAA
ncbi:ATP-binding cassette domain-containing protein [Permianibacter sp. IMCC34836]|uniref:ABC transporter ATP-binding protein n=1 Tax=Permianibacter fluminis TaxID=2738515 RepID=UPI0015517153|nr:ATP-binding cassette domain-containing protein [Permianibacter fluminis]NQD35788.1 ATP-binding cassette domain-containing protein [Permianibacter fluminis]